jgi:hypothetical protein
MAWPKNLQLKNTLAYYDDEKSFVTLATQNILTFVETNFESLKIMQFFGLH